MVNEFTTLVLSTNTRNRVGLAENRLAFYQQEVQRLGDDLDQQNAKILEFKQKNADALPENLRYSQDRQSLLQERVSRLESDLSTLQAQKQDMVRLFEQTGSIRQNDTPQTPEAPEAPEAPETPETPEAPEATKMHPKVVTYIGEIDLFAKSEPKCHPKCPQGCKNEPK